MLDENPVLDELSVEYVPQIGFLTALHRRYSDLAPPDFSFAFAQASALPPTRFCACTYDSRGAGTVPVG